jgi:hypothetical protein
MDLPEKIILSTDFHTMDILKKLDSSLKKARPDWVDTLPTSDDLETHLKRNFKNTSLQLETLGNALNGNIAKIADLAGASASDSIRETIAKVTETSTATLETRIIEIAGILTPRMDALEAKLDTSKEVMGETRNDVEDRFSEIAGMLTLRMDALEAKLESSRETADKARDAVDAKFIEIAGMLTLRIDALETKIESSKEETSETRKALTELTSRPQLDQEAIVRSLMDAVGRAAAWVASKNDASVTASESRTAAFLDGLTAIMKGLEVKLAETEATLATINAHTLAQATKAALPWYKRIIR